jgi:hypothetical protein
LIGFLTIAFALFYFVFRIYGWKASENSGFYETFAKQSEETQILFNDRLSTGFFFFLIFYFV